MFAPKIAKNSNGPEQSPVGKKGPSTDKSASLYGNILSLHKTLGNQAVQRLIESGALQTKLTVGKPNDIYEQEADQVAEQVMRMPDLSKPQSKEELQRQTQDLELESSSEEELHRQPIEEEEEKELRRQPMEEEEEEELRRQPVEEEEELQMQPIEEEKEEVLQTKRVSSETLDVSSDIESRIYSQKGGGQHLPESSRSFFETRFGYDFSNVRVHTGPESNNLNRSLNARAFTTGHDIFFRQGEYNPGSSGGRELLAHELTHVVQQNGESVQRKEMDESSGSRCSCLSSVSAHRKIQRKLVLGKSDGISEKEVDHVAERVMRMPELSKAQRKGVSEYNKFPSVERMCAKCEEGLHRQTQDLELGPLEHGYSSEEELQRKLEDESTFQAQENILRGPPDTIHEGFQNLNLNTDFTSANYFNSTAPPHIHTPIIQRVCTECEEELHRQTMEEEEEELVASESTHTLQQSGAEQTNIPNNSQTLANQTAPIPDQKEEISNPGNLKPTVTSANSSVIEERDKSQSSSQNIIFNPGSFSVISRVFPLLTMPIVPQIQRRANVSLAPTDLSCITMDIHGVSGELDLLFGQNQATLTAANLALIENYVGTWVARGLSPDLIISGYASKEGSQRHNWRLSCERAEAVQVELIRLGVPNDKTTIFAHGETVDFDSANLEPNRRATIDSTPGTGPTINPVLTPFDPFAGRSLARFGLGESIWLSYSAALSIAAAEHFGVQWALVTGTGTVINLPLLPALYTAGNTPATEQLALVVSTGPAAGTQLIVANVPIIAPSLSYMVQVPGTGLCHTTGTASAGFLGRAFMMPTDVSFSNIQWREGAGTATGTGSLSGLNGKVHGITPWFSIGGGNVATGCQINMCDRVSVRTSASSWSLFGGTDWSGTFIHPIQWQYQALGGPVVTYMTAISVATIDKAGNTSRSKLGAGPFTTALGDPTSCVVGCGITLCC